MTYRLPLSADYWMLEECETRNGAVHYAHCVSKLVYPVI
jgi:hypothetical protein